MRTLKAKVADLFKIQLLDRVSKGDSIAIPTLLLNRSTEIWGEDANEFRCAAALRSDAIIA